MQNLLASAGAPRFVSFVGWIFLLPLAAVDASAIAPVHANIQRLRLFRIFVGVFLLVIWFTALEVGYTLVSALNSKSHSLFLLSGSFEVGSLFHHLSRARRASASWHHPPCAFSVLVPVCFDYGFTMTLWSSVLGFASGMVLRALCCYLPLSPFEGAWLVANPDGLHMGFDLWMMLDAPGVRSSLLAGRHRLLLLLLRLALCCPPPGYRCLLG